MSTVFVPIYNVEISSEGAVRKDGKIIEPSLVNERPYVRVRQAGSSRNYIALARLVAMTWLGLGKHSRKVVLNQDGDLLNCRKENLEILTWEEFGARVRARNPVKNNAIRVRRSDGVVYKSISDVGNLPGHSVALIRKALREGTEYKGYTWEKI